MEIDKKELGNRIKKIRLKNGLTQEKFGELFENKELNENKANRGIVSAWERGASVPSPYRLKKIAEIADVSVHILLYGNLYSMDYPEQYKFIRKNLHEVYSTHKEYKKLNEKKQHEELDGLIQKYFTLYTVGIDPVLIEAIDTEDNLLFKSIVKHDYKDDAFFSDAELGYVRSVIYQLYDLSTSLAIQKENYYSKHKKMPPHSDYIADLLNETYSSIFELLDRDEARKMKLKFSDKVKILSSDFGFLNNLDDIE